VHGNADYDEILQVEEKTLANAEVQAAIAKLQLPAEAVVCCDPWIYGMFFLAFFSLCIPGLPFFSCAGRVG
jgi:hypothetical protein